MYGKIVNGVFVEAPNSIVCNIEVKDEMKPYKIFNPTDKQYKEAGYFPVIKAEYPETDIENPKYYELVYTERDGAIYGEWVECEAPEIPDTVPTLEQRTTALEEEVDGLNEALNMILEGVTE